MLVRLQLKEGILWLVSWARVRVIYWNCDMYVRFHCKFEKLLWFTFLLFRWSVHDKLSREMERNNAVCVSPRISFWTKSQYSKNVWLPAFKSTGHWPEFFTTAIVFRFCWSSWQLPSKFFFDSCLCSPCWHSTTVAKPSIFFKSCGFAPITKPFCSTFLQNLTWNSIVALSTFHEIIVDLHVASLRCWVVRGRSFSF